MVYLYSFFNLDIRWDWVVKATPLVASPSGMSRYTLYSRLGEPQERSGWVRKIYPPPGFEPPTFRPVANRYPD